MSANTSYRICPTDGLLTKDDYRFGFGLDMYLYNRINEARKQRGLQTRDDFKEDWDSREGYSIDGKRLNTRFHPFHNLYLIEKSTGHRYIVDAVHKHHYYGFYIVLSIRKEGTKSHGQAIWKNYTCKDPTVLEGLKEAHERFYSEDELMEIEKNKKFPHTIFFFESGKWNESSGSISRNTMNASYHKFDKGDIYFRFNGEKIYCMELNGENTKGYDMDYGIGLEAHYGKSIDVNDLMKLLHRNYYYTYAEVTRKLIARGFKNMWVAEPPKKPWLKDS